MSTPATASITWYLLACRQCSDLTLPFLSASERATWAAAHTEGTGHDQWLVMDKTQDGDPALLAAAIAKAVPPTGARPRCRECLTYDVSMRVIGPLGFTLWYCAKDWAAERELGNKIMQILDDAVSTSKQASDQPQPNDQDPHNPRSQAHSDSP